MEQKISSVAQKGVLMKRSNFPGRKRVRQDEAKVRQDAYDKVSYEVKLKAAGPEERRKLLAKGG